MGLSAGLIRESILGCADRGGRGENQNLGFDHVSLDNLHAFGRPFGPHPACAPLRLPFSLLSVGQPGGRGIEGEGNRQAAISTNVRLVDEPTDIGPEHERTD